jgi:hypothetical protein
VLLKVSALLPTFNLEQQGRPSADRLQRALLVLLVSKLVLGPQAMEQLPRELWDRQPWEVSLLQLLPSAMPVKALLLLLGRIHSPQQLAGLLEPTHLVLGPGQSLLLPSMALAEVSFKLKTILGKPIFQSILWTKMEESEEL